MSLQQQQHRSLFKILRSGMWIFFFASCKATNSVKLTTTKSFSITSTKSIYTCPALWSSLLPTCNLLTSTWMPLKVCLTCSFPIRLTNLYINTSLMMWKPHHPLSFILIITLPILVSAGYMGSQWQKCLSLQLVPNNGAKECAGASWMLLKR